MIQWSLKMRGQLIDGSVRRTRKEALEHLGVHRDAKGKVTSKDRRWMRLCGISIVKVEVREVSE